MMTSLALALAVAQANSTYFICSSQDSSSGRTIVYIGEPVRAPYEAMDELKASFKQDVRQRYGVALGYSGCATADTAKQAKDGVDYAVSFATRQNAGVQMVPWSPSGTTKGSTADAAPAAGGKAKSKPVEAASTDDTTAEAPRRPKKSNAQADAEYAAAMATYREQLADRDRKLEEHRRTLDAMERQKVEQRAAAQRALAAFEQEKAAHARQVEAQQLDYQKMVSKPAGVPNPVFRGFTGPDCDFARRSAVMGAGTSSGTKFKEVTVATVDGHCLVQGWWWDTSRTGASRQ